MYSLIREGTGSRLPPCGVATAAQTGSLGCPLSGQRSDLTRRNTGLLFRPFRGLGHAVIAETQNVLLELIESDSPFRNILFVIPALGDPYVRNCHRQRRIGTRPRRQPSAVHGGGRVIEERVDKNRFDSFFLQPNTPNSRFLPTVCAASSVRVVGPENNHLGMLQGIFQ